MVKFAILLFILAVIVIAIIYSWINGIDYMNKNYPEYKGEDLFSEDTKKDI